MHAEQFCSEPQEQCPGKYKVDYDPYCGYNATLCCQFKAGHEGKCQDWQRREFEPEDQQ